MRDDPQPVARERPSRACRPRPRQTSVISARTAVTLTLPVAEAPPGIMPSRLLNRTKKKTVQRYGKKRSAPWPPIAGRATSSRMKSSIASNMFMNQPRLYGVRAMWRTTGTKIDDHEHRRDHLHHHEAGELQPQDLGQMESPARTSAGSTTATSIVSWSTTWARGFSECPAMVFDEPASARFEVERLESSPIAPVTAGNRPRDRQTAHLGFVATASSAVVVRTMHASRCDPQVNSFASRSVWSMNSTKPRTAPEIVATGLVPHQRSSPTPTRTGTVNSKASVVIREAQAMPTESQDRDSR